MTGQDAQAVAAWRYPGQYAFYNWDADPADLAELLDPAGWGVQYFAVDGPDASLVGFFQFKPDGDAMEIGLGLRPDLTGRGSGLSFVEVGVGFAACHFGVSSVSLAVAAFNQRAIKIYRRARFDVVYRYMHATNGSVYPFVRMVRDDVSPEVEPAG
jgi:[ribosomal protein S18]-alanine N-acetyltransferase